MLGAAVIALTLMGVQEARPLAVDVELFEWPQEVVRTLEEGFKSDYYTGACIIAHRAKLFGLNLRVDNQRVHGRTYWRIDEAILFGERRVEQGAPYCTAPGEVGLIVFSRKEMPPDLKRHAHQVMLMLISERDDIGFTFLVTGFSNVHRFGARSERGVEGFGAFIQSKWGECTFKGKGCRKPRPKPKNT